MGKGDLLVKKIMFKRKIIKEILFIKVMHHNQKTTHQLSEGNIM
jgi:hypothetical protein